MDQQAIIGTIRLIEEQLMMFAASMEGRYDIKPGTYRISLLVEPKKEYERKTYISSGIIVSSIGMEQKINKNVIKIHNGAVVHIEIPFALGSKDDPFTFFKAAAKLIDEAFRYLSSGHKVNRDKELFNPTVVGRYIHEWDGMTWQRGLAVWNKRVIKKADLEKGSFVRESYYITVKRVVEIKHKVTGIRHTLVDTKNRSGYDLTEQALNECAMIVESKFRAPMMVPISKLVETRFALEVIHSMNSNSL